MCINTTSSSLNLSGGKVSKSLLENGGKTLQDQCNKYVKDHGKVPVWGFATTSGGDTPFNFIIHTVGGKYNHVNAAKVCYMVLLCIFIASCTVCISYTTALRCIWILGARCPRASASKIHIHQSTMV